MHSQQEKQQDVEKRRIVEWIRSGEEKGF